MRRPLGTHWLTQCVISRSRPGHVHGDEPCEAPFDAAPPRHVTLGSTLCCAPCEVIGCHSKPQGADAPCEAPFDAAPPLHRARPGACQRMPRRTHWRTPWRPDSPCAKGVQWVIQAFAGRVRGRATGCHGAPIGAPHGSLMHPLARPVKGRLKDSKGLLQRGATLWRAL